VSPPKLSLGAKPESFMSPVKPFRRGFFRMRLATEPAAVTPTSAAKVISLCAEVCPTSAGKGSGTSDWTQPRGRHGTLKMPQYIRAGRLFMAPQRYLCVRYWKRQI